ncbi:hypothetical protein SLA2020_090410 [Shorea laevis]
MLSYVLTIATHLKWIFDFLLRLTLPHDFDLPIPYTTEIKQELRTRKLQVDEEAVECAVCLCKIEEDEEIRELRCNHIFHSVCLDRWLQYKHSTCPLCRNSFAPSRIVAQVEVLFFNYCSFNSRDQRETWWLR